MFDEMDMSDVIDTFSNVFTFSSVTQTVADGKPVNTYEDFDAMASIQPASPALIIKLGLDSNFKYLDIAVTSDIILKIGDLVTYYGDKYKAYQFYPAQDYGYRRLIFMALRKNG